MRFRILIAATIASASLPCAGLAQTPAGWRVIADGGERGTTALSFETMAPGWHVTAGPPAMLFDPRHAVSGPARTDSEFFLFTSTPGSGFGVLFGGRDLGSPNGRYAAVIVGPDGRYRVIKRDGATVRDLVPWTAHEAVAKHPGGEANVKQLVSITTDDRVVRVAINGMVVTELSRAAVQPDGIVGFAIDRGVNVHASTLVIGAKNVAPVRGR